MQKSVIFLGAAVVLNVMVSVLFKQSSREDTNFAIIMLVSGVLLGAFTALCYAKSLTTIDLSVAYPVFAAASIILVCLVSIWLFRETVSVRRALGMATIIGGMVLVCAK